MIRLKFLRVPSIRLSTSSDDWYWCCRENRILRQVNDFCCESRTTILILPTIILIGILGSTAGDAATIILPPLAAMLLLKLAITLLLV